MSDRIGDCGRCRHQGDFCQRLGAVGAAGRGLPHEHDLDRRCVGRPRHKVIAEAGNHRPPVLEKQLFARGGADSHRDAADDLAAGADGIDDGAGIVGGHDLENTELSRSRVHVDLDAVGGETIAWRQVSGARVRRGHRNDVDFRDVLPLESQHPVHAVRVPGCQFPDRESAAPRIGKPVAEGNLVRSYAQQLRRPAAQGIRHRRSRGPHCVARHVGRSARAGAGIDRRQRRVHDLDIDIFGPDPEFVGANGDNHCHFSRARIGATACEGDSPVLTDLDHGLGARCRRRHHGARQVHGNRDADPASAPPALSRPLPVQALLHRANAVGDVGAADLPSGNCRLARAVHVQEPEFCRIDTHSLGDLVDLRLDGEDRLRPAGAPKRAACPPVDIDGPACDGRTGETVLGSEQQGAITHHVGAAVGEVAVFHRDFGVAHTHDPLAVDNGLQFDEGTVLMFGMGELLGSGQGDQNGPRHVHGQVGGQHLDFGRPNARAEIAPDSDTMQAHLADREAGHVRDLELQVSRALRRRPQMQHQVFVVPRRKGGLRFHAGVGLNPVFVAVAKTTEAVRDLGVAELSVEGRGDIGDTPLGPHTPGASAQRSAGAVDRGQDTVAHPDQSKRIESLFLGFRGHNRDFLTEVGNEVPGERKPVVRTVVDIGALGQVPRGKKRGDPGRLHRGRGVDLEDPRAGMGAAQDLADQRLARRRTVEIRCVADRARSSFIPFGMPHMHPDVHETPFSPIERSASITPWYPVQRQRLPDRARRSAMSDPGSPSRSSATQRITMPGVQ